MKFKLKRIIALMLALAMVFALAACGDDDDDEDTDGKSNNSASVVSRLDPMTEPDAYLEAAMEVTYQDIVDRTNAEPMISVGNILASDSTALGLEIGAVVPSSGLDNISFSGTLYGDGSDVDNLKLRLDGTLSMEAQGASIALDAGLYLDPDFVGVYFPYITGTDSFYGLQPHDFYEQAAGSIFDESSGSMFGGLDLDSLKQLDDAMASLADALASIPFDTMQTELEELDVDLDISLSTREQKVGYMGSQLDGYAISSSIGGEQMADILEDLSGKLFASETLESVLSFVESTGEVSREELDDAISEAREEIQSTADALRQSDISLEITYYIANERVVSTDLILTGGDDRLALGFDFYGSDGKTVSFTMPEFEGVSVSFTETVDTSAGYSNITTVQITAEGDTVLCTSTQTWDSASGRCSFSMVMDMSGDDVNPADSHVEFELDGTLTVSDGSFSFVSDELSFDVDGEEITLNISVSCTKDVVVPEPAEEVNIFELSEADLVALIQSLSALM